MRKILIVTHKPDSDPGLVGQLLQAQGCMLDVRCPAAGAHLPQHLEDHDGVVMFGGPMSANDEAELPFIRDELNWLPLVLGADRPFLGICLGAQILARVLGASVAPHPEDWREIGYAAITPIDQPNNLLADLTAVYQWHKEGFELPQTATLLATGTHFPQQAFQYGSAYGLQFHPEITPPLIDRWTTEGAELLSLPGAQPRSEQFQSHLRHGATVASWLDRFLNQWLS